MLTSLRRKLNNYLNLKLIKKTNTFKFTTSYAPSHVAGDNYIRQYNLRPGGYRKQNYFQN